MAKLPRSLHGRVVVVTGGGRGIGKAIAGALAAKGCRVAIGDLDAYAAREAAEELGGEAVGLALDVTDHAGFTTFLDEVERRLGPVDVLVNNAGIMAVGPFDEEDDATAVRQLEINLHAVIHGTKEAVRRMKPRGTGHIVNVASSAGKTGVPNLATYCATKHGVVGLSEAVRFELRGTGVEISVVMPGIVRTELAAGLVEMRGFKITTPEEVADAGRRGARVPPVRRLRAQVDRADVGRVAGPPAPRARGDRARPQGRPRARSTPTATPGRPTRRAPRRALPAPSASARRSSRPRAARAAAAASPPPRTR